MMNNVVNEEDGLAKSRHRASRKGQLRRFVCDYDGCEKRYSRAEHLARHRLNHNPTQVFHCGIDGCQQTFVRTDLLVRHEGRHISSSASGRRNSKCDPNPKVGFADQIRAWATPDSGIHHPTSSDSYNTEQLSYPNNTGQPTYPDNAAPLYPDATSALQHARHGLPGMTSNSSTVQSYMQAPPAPTGQAWAPQAISPLANDPSYGSGVNETLLASHIGQQQEHILGYIHDNDPHLSRDNFATWLLDVNASTADLDMTNLPFLDFGLESTFSDAFNYHLSDAGSLGGERPSSIGHQPPDEVQAAEIRISESRRQEIIQLVLRFRQAGRVGKQVGKRMLIDDASDVDIPDLSASFLEGCVSAFWNLCSPQMPIIHRPSFAADSSHLLLLTAMISLGVAEMVNINTKGTMKEYMKFADLLVTNLRWEIFTDEDAQPPAQLWVAQALLLLELYEKMYSSRRLHERANIHHASTLTLLRRGSPLIGRSGSETPPPAFGTGPENNHGKRPANPHGSVHAWWFQWAKTEAMHRAVFAAFMMDTTHAVMFGHAADMAPHEIRLLLPCDEAMWTAGTAESVQHLETSLRMYGVKPISFLDGLKRSLHGQEVKTHPFARMVLMSGLLSVGWHVSHRETQLKWLETSPSVKEQERWRKLLLRAFDDWKRSFDDAVGTSEDNADGPAHDAAVMYRLAHISMHVDIIDCQVYAGSKRLLGRRVSVRDHANVLQRTKAWANTAAARHAVMHAFKFLREVLVRPDKGAGSHRRDAYIQYSCRQDHIHYRPWVVYLAALTIWAFQHASAASSQSKHTATDRKAVACEYLTQFAVTSKIDSQILVGAQDGCAALLEFLQECFHEAESELLVEASTRMEACRLLLGRGAT